MIVSYVIARRRKYPVHRVELTLRGLLRSLGEASYALVMPVFIMGALVLGVCTATEVGALACVYAIVIGIFVTKKLKWKDLVPIALRAGIITSAILMLISVGYVASWFFAVHQVAQKIGDFMLSISSGPIPFLLLTNVVLLISGCLLDIGAGMVLLVPILLPIATHYGIHPYHFAFMVNYALIIGLITPPVGVILFVCVGMRKDLTMEQLVQALPPYLAVMLVVLALVTFIPDIPLIVPRLFGMIK
jgi:tripartite ATP-independent transporter DctM subunit